MLRKDFHEDNRRSWNVATDVHNSHKADQAKFFREGGSTLYPEEIELLGEIAGKSLVHLQCNAGQDTLSLARLGAQVTGVDISDTAIDFARQLSAESGIPGTFHRSDVYDWLSEAAAGEKRYDRAFSSYGAIIWLSDIRLWAQGIAAILKPGGWFSLVEFHPFIMVYENDWTMRYSYNSTGKPTTFNNGIGDYVAMTGSVAAPSGYLEGVKDFVNPLPSHEFSWGLGEIVSALADAGLRITTLREYPYMNGGRLFDDMRELEPGRFYPPEHMPNLPVMFGLRAQKPYSAHFCV